MTKQSVYNEITSFYIDENFRIEKKRCSEKQEIASKKNILMFLDLVKDLIMGSCLRRNDKIIVKSLPQYLLKQFLILF